MPSDNLPTVEDSADVAEDVIDGQVVDEPGTRQVVVLRPVVQVVQVVVKPEHAQRARHGAYIAAGVVVAARR